MKTNMIFLAILLGLLACSSNGQVSNTSQADVAVDTAVADAPYNVNINPDDFVTRVDNPYFPRIPGALYIYEGMTEDGLEHDEIEILSETHEVMGIQATIMHDVVYLDGELIEETFDWFAQDKEGNVWYLGEDVDNYEDGVLQNHDGSWEAGTDGALPGIVMFANPADHIGETVRQEYYPGEAEDMADILSVTEQITVPIGRFENVLQTYDYTPLEPDAQEHKFYASGIGEIRTVDLVMGEEFVLLEYTPGSE